MEKELFFPGFYGWIGEIPARVAMAKKKSIG